MVGDGAGVLAALFLKSHRNVPRSRLHVLDTGLLRGGNEGDSYDASPSFRMSHSVFRSSRVVVMADPTSLRSNSSHFACRALFLSPATALSLRPNTGVNSSSKVGLDVTTPPAVRTRSRLTEPKFLLRAALIEPPTGASAGEPEAVRPLRGRPAQLDSTRCRKPAARHAASFFDKTTTPGSSGHEPAGPCPSAS